MSGSRRGANGMGELPGWAELEAAVPQVAATMRRWPPGPGRTSRG